MYREEIMQVTSALQAPGKDHVRSVKEYAEQHPGEVNDTVVSLAPKYEHFRTGYYWFGVVQLGVRLLQTSLLTFFNTPKVQAAFASMVALCMISVQRELRPFVSRSDNLVALLALWCLFIWMSGLLLIRARVLDRVAPALTGTILVLVPCGLVGTSVYCMVTESTDTADVKVSPDSDRDRSMSEPDIEMADLFASRELSNASEGTSSRNPTSHSAQHIDEPSTNPMHAERDSDGRGATTLRVLGTAANRVSSDIGRTSTTRQRGDSHMTLRAAVNAVLSAIRFAGTGVRLQRQPRDVDGVEESKGPEATLAATPYLDVDGGLHEAATGVLAEAQLVELRLSAIVREQEQERARTSIARRRSADAPPFGASCIADID